MCVLWSCHGRSWRVFEPLVLLVACSESDGGHAGATGLRQAIYDGWAMLTLGFAGLLVGPMLLVILFALGRVWTLEIAFIRLAWVPVAALALQGMLWRPMTRTLSYASIIPPLLTCIVSLFFGIVGATLLAGGSRAVQRPGLLWATMLASVPGALLVTYVLIIFVRFYILFAST